MRFSSGRIIPRQNAPPSTRPNSKSEYVIKYGATTGLTKGYIARQNANYQHVFEVMNDMPHTAFSRPGDSGSLVLLVRNANCAVHTYDNRQGQCSCDVDALGIVIAFNNAGITYCLYVTDSLRLLGLQNINTCIPFHEHDSVPSYR